MSFIWSLPVNLTTVSGSWLELVLEHMEMPRPSIFVGLIAFTAAACGDPETRIPTTPSPPGVTAIEISGPATLAPGHTAQLVAVMTLADGTTKTSSPGTPAAWSTSNSAILQVNSAGLLTATLQRGEARVTVRVGSGASTRQASRDIVVLPDGSYRLVGVVRDAENPAFPLAGVTVEATPGSVSATTNSEGGYRLYGVPAEAVIRVSKSGYVTVAQPVQLSAHGTQNFELGQDGSRAVLDGNYTLTLDMVAGCTRGGSLSADLRRRVYEATVTQSGPLVEVVLTEPCFRTNRTNRGNRFSGYADSAGVRFNLEPYDSYYYPSYGPNVYPSVAETLSNGTFLVPEGQAFVVGSAARMSGGFNATFYHWDSAFPNLSYRFVSPLGFCSSPETQMTLTQR